MTTVSNVNIVQKSVLSYLSHCRYCLFIFLYQVHDPYGYDIITMCYHTCSIHARSSFEQIIHIILRKFINC